jgi:hypothetical protein
VALCHDADLGRNRQVVLAELRGLLGHVVANDLSFLREDVSFRRTCAEPLGSQKVISLVESSGLNWNQSTRRSWDLLGLQPL